MFGILDNHVQKDKLDSYLTPYTKINSKWIKDLKVIARPDTIKLVGGVRVGDIREKPLNIGLGNFFFFFSFLDIALTGNKSKTKQVGLQQTKKLKSFCQQRKKISKIKK